MSDDSQAPWNRLTVALAEIQHRDVSAKASALAIELVPLKRQQNNLTAEDLRQAFQMYAADRDEAAVTAFLGLPDGWMTHRLRNYLLWWATDNEQLYPGSFRSFADYLDYHKSVDRQNPVIRAYLDTEDARKRDAEVQADHRAIVARLTAQGLDPAGYYGDAWPNVQAWLSA